MGPVTLKPLHSNLPFLIMSFLPSIATIIFLAGPVVQAETDRSRLRTGARTKMDCSSCAPPSLCGNSVYRNTIFSYTQHVMNRQAQDNEMH